MKHEVTRDVSGDETRLWQAVRGAKSDTETIQVVQLAQSTVGNHPARVRQIVRTWDNEGLVTAIGDANQIRVTEYGRRVTEISSDLRRGSTL